jgi:hypothetical protein
MAVIEEIDSLDDADPSRESLTVTDSRDDSNAGSPPASLCHSAPQTSHSIIFPSFHANRWATQLLAP